MSTPRPAAALNRRQFLASSSAFAALALAGCASDDDLLKPRQPLFQISLAEWSYNRAIFGKKMTHLDFPIVARRTHDIDAIELVNQFFMDKAKDQAYLREFKTRADTEGVAIKLIMCDDEGDLGDVDPAKRKQAVDNHRKWADAAKFFGCHSIRVNAETGGKGSFEEQQKRAADGLRPLTEYCASLGLNCIVENHGGLASNGKWLVGLMKLVDHPRAGLLPDFGNWYDYDRYQGVTDMMPYARAVSAKTHDFDQLGNCTETDYRRMLKIVLKAGYHRWLGIEYEGEHIPEAEGVKLTKLLLQRVEVELASEALKS
jgi:L-ribulose-5-phosphate 3-epimerase